MVPLSRLPIHLRTATNFGLGSNLAASNQSRKWVMQTRGGLPAHLQTYRTELHTVKLLAGNLVNTLRCYSQRQRQILPLSPSSPASPTLSFTALCVSFLSPHIFNPSPCSAPASEWSPGEPELIICYIFFGRSLMVRRDSLTSTMPPPSPVILSLASSHPPGDCKCTQSLKQGCYVSCHQAHWGQPCLKNYPYYKRSL